MTEPRPTFPKRAVITAGMPYGNKSLHFGHIGGVFVHADVYARFLRDRLGKDNVIFVSGTDCYGSPIVEHHRKLVESGEYAGSLRDFVQRNHDDQKATLAAYLVELDLFAASALGRAGELHAELSAWIFETLHRHGHLDKLETQQFYDPEREVFLNGRQVEGQCPIQGCRSDRGYADECSQGHQYLERELLNPKSTLTGKRPELRTVTNWYIDLAKFRDQLTAWADAASQAPGARPFAMAVIRDFFGEPEVHVVKKHLEALEEVRNQMPPHKMSEGRSKSMTLSFDSLDQREAACEVLSQHNIPFRNGKTLVPFRLTGNLEWGVPVPAVGGEGLTFWVWPESLWAPMSFTAAYLESKGQPSEAWRDWWCGEDVGIYQFIGEDNVYFYGPAEMALFMGTQPGRPSAVPGPGQLQLPELVVNRHLLFLGNKASSSGKVKPPMAMDLLQMYKPEQLRAHFINLGLHTRNIGFRPKPLDPNAPENAPDPALKEAKLLERVLNRLARSCFYGCQKHTAGKIPPGEVSTEVKQQCDEAILAYEQKMFERDFPGAFSVAEALIREANKYWHTASKAAGDNSEGFVQPLVDAFHYLRTSVLLMHPVAPEGCEKVRRQLAVGEALWSWEHAFEPLYSFMDDPKAHRPLHLEPRVDFFEAHPSQFER